MSTSKPALLQLLALPVVPDTHERLSRYFNVVHLWEESDPDAAILKLQNDVTALLTSAVTATPAALMDRLPRLQAICSAGVGYDTIDVKHAIAKGIQVSNTPDVLNDCVADLTWGLLLATARGIGRAERYVRAGQWRTTVPTVPLGTRVSGKKLGIVGLGRIGLAIAQRAGGFNMDIRYHNRTARTDVPWTHESSLPELAAWADILIVATVGGPSTYHLINLPILQALGPKGILINIARGSVVDEIALTEALSNGTLGAAGLDVFESEPQVPEALKKMENVVLLPHIASATNETRYAMVNLAVENAEAFARTGKVMNLVTL